GASPHTQWVPAGSRGGSVAVSERNGSLWFAEALGPGQAQGTFHTAGRGAGSSHPSLAAGAGSYSWPARLGGSCWAAWGRVGVGAVVAPCLTFSLCLQPCGLIPNICSWDAS
uniref:Uncharacterized protein n=1 Tax=Gallus gallus TaxID=9031 RepID=A0A8V1A361_CHICK